MPFHVRLKKERIIVAAHPVPERKLWRTELKTMCNQLPKVVCAIPQPIPYRASYAGNSTQLAYTKCNFQLGPVKVSEIFNSFSA